MYRLYLSVIFFLLALLCFFIYLKQRRKKWLLESANLFLLGVTLILVHLTTLFMSSIPITLLLLSLTISVIVIGYKIGRKALKLFIEEANKK